MPSPYPSPNPTVISHTTPRDWTEDLPQTDHVRFFTSVDWARTQLGPMAQWETSLRMYTYMVMSDSRAATLYWGPNHIAIYNEQFVPLAAGAHPLLMGQPFAFGFPELVPLMKPLFEEGVRSGVAQDVIESPMMVERNGYQEETFFTGNFNPIRGPDGAVDGFYNALFEVTLQKIRDRRSKLLNLIASPGVLTTQEAYSHIITSLSTDPLDVPMAILYEADEDAKSRRTVLRLRGQLGVPDGHGLLLDGQELEGSEGIMSLYREAVSGRVVTSVDQRFDGLQWLGFDQPTNQIVTLALTTGVRLFGFLTIGTNPCRPFDEHCEQFVKELSRMASSVIAAAQDAEDLRRKQEQLQNELDFSDMKIRHLVQHASVGMAHAEADGTLVWANEKFFTLAGASSEVHNAMESIYEVFLDEDREKAEQVWSSIMNGENHVSAEIRLKRLFVPPVGDPEPAQIQVLAFPYKERGVTVSGMACTTEISRLKWAEAWQARIAEDAREAKRQQEQFIDMVSHEMRNPLSAIVHCADTISASLEDIRVKEDAAKIPVSILDALKDNVSAAAIILDCAKHQKRIIDDVLTLGRLESTLLSVTPSAVRPSKLVDSVMALFEAELHSNSITTKVIGDPSMELLGVDHLNLDPSRVTQIFMNLLTNAIKFVKAEKTRKIEVRYGAALASIRSTSGADACLSKVHWAPKGKNAIDVTGNPEWGTGEIIYLTFSLSDTGIGMRENEILKIFERFRQASVKTHATYGGSGLGLYISKELTEKMGGEIGAMSRPGEGSMFVFYIKTRRVGITTKDPPLQAKPNNQVLSTRKIRVLLVEDNLINQRVLRKHLTKSDCIVDVANHGLEALEALRKPGAHFDVVLMDMQMPIMDGLTCTTEIRVLEKEGSLKGRLPIIAVTANVRQEQIDTAIAAGADCVVQKPFKAADLIASLREITHDTMSQEERPENKVNELPFPHLDHPVLVDPGSNTVATLTDGQMSPIGSQLSRQTTLTQDMVQTGERPAIGPEDMHEPNYPKKSKKERPSLAVEMNTTDHSSSDSINSVLLETPVGTSPREKNAPLNGSDMWEAADIFGELEVALRPLMPARSRTH